tara:strand:+ start:168 stop:353 length:186 start_codon:yes stop_codon:yes gene_type:complete
MASLGSSHDARLYDAKRQNMEEVLKALRDTCITEDEDEKNTFEKEVMCADVCVVYIYEYWG